MLNLENTHDSAFVNPDSGNTLVSTTTPDPMVQLAETLARTASAMEFSAAGMGAFVAKLHSKPREKKASAESQGCADSIELQFSDLLCDPAGPFGHFCIEERTPAGGLVVRRWNGDFWDYCPPEELDTIASVWLSQHHRGKKTAKKAEGCRKLAEIDLRGGAALPRPALDEVVLSLPGKYLAVSATGQIHCEPPDKEFGLTFGMTLDAPGAVAGEAYEPSPLPEGSEFRAWLEFAQPDPAVRDFIQEQCALALIPECTSHAAWYCGAAGSGKSTLVEMVSRVVSKTARISMDQLGETFGLAPIVGASIICTDEVDGGKICHEGHFKSIVSGNGLCINRKNLPQIADYHNRAMWFICSNPEPAPKDRTEGVWRRLGVVRWENRIPPEKAVLNFHEHLLATEGTIFLDWLLMGLQRVVARGRKLLPESQWPVALQKTKQAIKNQTDSVRAWVEDEGVFVGSAKKRSTGDVYARYTDFCENASLMPLPNSIFFRELREFMRPLGWDGAHETRRTNIIREGQPVRMRFIAIEWVE